MSLTRSKHMNMHSLILQMGSNTKTYSTSTSCFILTNTPETNSLLLQKRLKVFDSKNINRYRHIQSIRCLNVFSYTMKKYTSDVNLLQEYETLKIQKKFDISLSSKVVEAHINENQIEQANKVHF